MFSISPHEEVRHEHLRKNDSKSAYCWYQEQPAELYHVPQELIDQLVLGNVETLSGCDRMRFAQTAAGYWTVSQMGEWGPLDALGLRVGDEMQAINGITLDSLDTIMNVVAGELRVRREECLFVLGARIDPI